MNETARVAALTLDSVERRYGRSETTVEVLSGASLELSAGQSVALVAPSGAGKSTLLHLAGLLERPSAGEVKIGGAATSTMSDDKRTALRRTEIGFVYQFHHLLPEFLGAGESRAAANDRRPAARPGCGARARTARLSRSCPAREPPTGRIVGRRTTARRYRARGPATVLGRRWPTSRPAISTQRPPTTCSRFRRAGQGERPRRPRRHPQHGPRRPNGSPRHDPRRAGCGDGVERLRG